MYRSIQASRAVAAMLVVAFHLGGAIAADKYFGLRDFAAPFAFGDAGVEFFFVLSGFIILTAHRSDIGRPKEVASYLWKRFIRIYPTYWIIFLSVLAAALAAPSLRETVPHDATVLLRAVMLLPQEPIGHMDTGAPVLIVAWTLHYELYFYTLFALLILSPWLAFAATIVLALLYLYCALTSTCDAYPLSFYSSDYVLLFGLGMGVAFFHRRFKSVDRPFFYFGIGVFIFLIVAADKVLNTELLIHRKTILYGLAAALIVFGLVVAENRGRIIGGSGWLQEIGQSSYALYLLHLPLISALCKGAVAIELTSLGVAGASIAYVAIFLICISAAVAFHRWIELPLFVRLRPRSTARVRTTHSIDP